MLPAGAVFPFDFGFVPNTRGGDGDPLDALILMDEPAFVGCLVPSRLLGVIEAEQTEKGKTARNDRLIAVASDSRIHREFKNLTDISGQLLDEIEHFFVSYNEAKGKKSSRSGASARSARWNWSSRAKPPRVVRLVIVILSEAKDR